MRSLSEPTWGKGVEKRHYPSLSELGMSACSCPVQHPPSLPLGCWVTPSSPPQTAFLPVQPPHFLSCCRARNSKGLVWSWSICFLGHIPTTLHPALDLTSFISSTFSQDYCEHQECKLRCCHMLPVWLLILWASVFPSVYGELASGNLIGVPCRIRQGVSCAWSNAQHGTGTRKP